MRNFICLNIRLYSGLFVYVSEVIVNEESWQIYDNFISKSDFFLFKKNANNILFPWAWLWVSDITNEYPIMLLWILL